MSSLRLAVVKDPVYGGGPWNLAVVAYPWRASGGLVDGDVRVLARLHVKPRERTSSLLRKGEAVVSALQALHPRVLEAAYAAAEQVKASEYLAG